MSKVRVALAQINATVGDLTGNAQRIVEAARQAHGVGASLMIAPELALSGYPPEDLLLRPAFLQACNRALEGLAGELASFDGLTVVVGHPAVAQGVPAVRTRSIVTPQRFNAASVLQDGRCVPPIASASCLTTRCSTNAAISSVAVTRGSGR